MTRLLPHFMLYSVLAVLAILGPAVAQEGTQARLAAAKAVLATCDANTSGKADSATCVNPLRAIAAACDAEAASYQGLPNFAVCVPVYNRLLNIYGSYEAYAAAMKR
jgi:hypothetical protein